MWMRGFAEVFSVFREEWGYPRFSWRAPWLSSALSQRWPWAQLPGIVLDLQPFFSEIKGGKGSVRKEGAQIPVERISLSFGFCVQEGLRDQESLLEQRFLSLLDVVLLLRFWAELASSCPALVATFLPGVSSSSWRGQERAWGQLTQAQGSGALPLLAAGREGAEAGFKLSLNLKNLKSAFLDLGNDKEQRRTEHKMGLVCGSFLLFLQRQNPAWLRGIFTHIHNLLNHH